MTRDKANTALLVPARAMQGANDVNRPVGRSVRSLDQVRVHGVGAGNGVKAGNGPHFGLHTCLAQTGQVAVTQPVASKALPMWKPSTGEPYAGKPPVRFGGRGGRKSFPTPIKKAWLSWRPTGRNVALIVGCPLSAIAGGRLAAVCRHLRAVPGLRRRSSRFRHWHHDHGC